MWLLSQKDGKPWWAKRDENNANWIPVSEEEYAAWKKECQDIRDTIAVKVFNKYFNTMGENK